MTPLIELTNIVKTFGGVQALRGVDFALQPGTVHGLAGENGAGKSTLMKVIAGVHPADSGEFKVDGAPAHFRSARDARAKGVGMVHQELSVAPDLSVAENVFLGSQPVNGLGAIAWRRMAREAAEQLKNLGLDIDPRARLGDFPIGVQQLVELARVLFSGARIIILDEPTSALSPPEIARLFTVLRRVRESGRGIIFISHFLDDILEISDEVSVFRNGLRVAHGEVGPGVDKAWIIENMIGAGRDELGESYLHDIALKARMQTPIVLDLAGHGVNTLSAAEGVNFDLNGTGHAAQYGWVGSGSGLLVMDVNGNGQIDNGTELFGAATLGADGHRAGNGFAAMAMQDTNHDNVLNASDANWNQLKVWVDGNADGKVETGELKGMADLGIASLNLAHQASTQVDHGNLVGMVGSYTTTDGQTHELADVWFSKADGGSSDTATGASSSSTSGNGAQDAGDAKLSLHDVLAGPTADVLGAGAAPGSSSHATTAAVHPAAVDHHALSTSVSPLQSLLDEQHKHGPLI